MSMAWAFASAGFMRYSLMSIFECSAHISQPSAEISFLMRSPRGPGKGRRLRAGSSRLNLAHTTVRVGSAKRFIFAGAAVGAGVAQLPPWGAGAAWEWPAWEWPACECAGAGGVALGAAAAA